MTLLDAYALVAFLVGGPAAATVRKLLRERDVGLATANLAEALDVSQRVHGLPITRAMEVLRPLLDETLVTRSLDERAAVRAAELRVKHYHRSTRPISLADAVLVATASPGDRIATADPDVLAVASAEGIATVQLLPQG